MSSSFRQVLPAIGAGAIAGLAWAASMRGMMAQLAGPDSEFHWLGTFGFILIPGTAMGALFGWAFARRIAGRRRGAAWLALAPFAMVADPATLPLLGAFVGAGFLFSPRSRRWVRLLAGIPSLILLIGVPVGAALVVGVGTPHGAWLAIQLGSLVWIPALAEIALQRPWGDTSADQERIDATVHSGAA
ncbi:hypothetical protein [Microbacterium azadirachtae]|uniref:hypothetical protein n=1 Tax=Microbacterium azadirachtae TaxID=582680 RepID=UPI00088B6670|nr:hypothetical protein [Microbacterium azadirachtae]UXW87381.1 hypothetical protein NFX31_07685 [Microbacterium azadirachtae]SDL20147.1 hypothetical protein SAMN04488593_0290 [Microbacterium azadirachtae]SEF50522.1 hypothetical protein SAMN04488594_0280 [Microbacterium azadirachtae]SEF50602.1 hypothetical protein SAMN04488592_0289 [Microbacterium azadirachtae]